MRTVKTIMLVLLVQLTLVAGIPRAMSQTNPQKGARNGDEYLNREVRHELMGVSRYSVFDILQYNVTGNDVTLTGAVTQPVLKTDAENAVKHIEGVNRINNQIEVLPHSPMDEQIRHAVYRAIYSQDLFARYALGSVQSIHIIVKGSNVTLEGNVETDTDKNAAGIFAKGVPNVFSVTNNLVVNGKK